MSKKFNVNDIVHERKNELDSSALFQAQSPPAPVQEEASTPPPSERDQEDTHVHIPSPLTNSQPGQSATSSLKRPVRSSREVLCRV